MIPMLSLRVIPGTTGGAPSISISFAHSIDRRRTLRLRFAGRLTRHRFNRSNPDWAYLDLRSRSKDSGESGALLMSGGTYTGEPITDEKAPLSPSVQRLQ